MQWNKKIQLALWQRCCEVHKWSCSRTLAAGCSKIKHLVAAIKYVNEDELQYLDWDGVKCIPEHSVKF